MVQHVGEPLVHQSLPVGSADHEVTVFDLDHLDVGAVQLRQRLGGHHLLDGADPESAVDQIQHPVHVRQDRVDLVGDDDDRGAGVAAAAVDQLRHQLGVGRVQRQQRFVAQQQHRVAGQRLGDPDPLQLAARHQPDPDVGQLFAVDLLQRPLHGCAPAGPIGGRAAPPRPSGARRCPAQPGRGRAASPPGRSDDVAAHSRWARCPPFTFATPALSGSCPSSTLSSEVLPVPLGPSTAMNSPAATDRSRLSHSTRSPNASRAPVSATASRCTGPVVSGPTVSAAVSWLTVLRCQVR